jgi:hypothetical protein
MLLTNEILSLLSVQLLITDNKRMICLVSMQSRLHIHFMVVSLIQTVFAYIYIVLLIFSVCLVIFSGRFRQIIHIIQSNIRLGSYSPSKRYRYAVVVLIKEVLLIFVYILFCYIYQWYRLSNNANHVTSMNIRRWFVEATFTPFLCFFFLIEYSVGRPNIIFDEYQLYYIAAISLKLPLFFFMRFAERQPEFFLNHFELFLLKKLCQLFSE